MTIYDKPAYSGGKDHFREVMARHERPFGMKVRWVDFMVKEIDHKAIGFAVSNTKQRRAIVLSADHDSRGKFLTYTFWKRRGGGNWTQLWGVVYRDDQVLAKRLWRPKL